MAYVRIVTIGKGTVIRNMKMDGYSTKAVDSAATALESIICEERDILKVEVDYEGCDDSNTLGGLCHE